MIDAVYFAEPKNSMIDIIQAVGRSLRKDRSKPDQISYIIIPMVISDQVSKFEDIDPKEFSTLHSVIQALRDQDRILADYIDKLNLKAARGKGHSHQEPDAPILVELSEQLDIGAFSESLSLRIAEVNRDPSKIAKEFLVSKASRASGIRRTFRTVGDYTIDAYYSSLVLPTLERYPSFSVGLPREAIAIDHNNVSHCVKIGALAERDLKFWVTDVGRALFEYRELSADIFREQMLKYYELDTITRIPRFPYRMALRVISALGSINRFEFVYSLYIIRHFGAQGEREAIVAAHEKSKRFWLKIQKREPLELFKKALAVLLLHKNIEIIHFFASSRVPWGSIIRSLPVRFILLGTYSIRSETLQSSTSQIRSR